jgi:hypothetical protein
VGWGKRVDLVDRTSLARRPSRRNRTALIARTTGSSLFSAIDDSSGECVLLYIMAFSRLLYKYDHRALKTSSPSYPATLPPVEGL